MQSEINLGLTGLEKPKDVDEMLILSICDSPSDAIRLVVQHSGLKHEYIAESLGINKGHFSRMLNRHGNRHFPLDKIHQLECVCRNRAFTQYMALVYGSKLVDCSTKEQGLNRDEVEQLRQLLKEAV